MHFFPKVQFVSSLHANWIQTVLLISILGSKVQFVSSLHANWIQTVLLEKNAFSTNLEKPKFEINFHYFF